MRNFIRTGKVEAYSEEAQHIRITNILAISILCLYGFYVVYGFFIDSWLTTVMAFVFVIITIVAYFINVKGHNSLAKVILFLVTSISILVTYQIFNIGDAILTSFFPLMMSYMVFFNLKKEKGALLLSIMATIFCLATSFLIPRHILLEVTLSDQVVQLSDMLHIVMSFILTSIILITALRNKDQANTRLLHEKQKAEEALEQLTHAQGHLIQSEKMASLGLMTAGINHEINNPLNFIIGGLENLKHALNGTEDENVEVYMYALDEGVNRISKIVSSLNHFNHHSTSMDMECPIEPILDNCLNILKHQIGNEITIEKSYQGEVVAKGNTGQLHQVFLNLIANAIQAMDGKGCITLSTSMGVTNASISVKDNGAGIPESILDKIFDPFFTTKEPGVGTGLGLSISYKIVGDHNGTIEVQSAEQKGTEFVVKLPVS